jgi:lysine 2,3-aminomutase
MKVDVLLKIESGLIILSVDLIWDPHFRTTVKKGLEIIKGLRGFTSGYAIPTFVVDAPGGGGKIPLLPDYVVEHNDERIVMRNYKGVLCEYPEK